MYQYVKIRNEWKFQIPSGPLERLKQGAYYVSWYEGKAKRMQRVGPDPRKAEAAVEKKRLELAFVAMGGKVQREADGPKTEIVNAAAPKRMSEAIAGYLGRCRARQGKSGYGMAPRSIETYRYHLGLLLQFAPDAYVGDADNDFLYAFLAFLRAHEKNFSDRTCYNIMQSVSTFLLKHDITVGRRILKEISFPPTEVIPYSEADLAKFFSACTQDEDLLYKFFLHSMARDMEIAHCEVRDLDFEKNLLHICPKPDRGLRLKGKRSRQDVKGRKVPLPVRLMERLKTHCQGKEPNSLVFPDRNGHVCTHYLNKCKRIARHAVIEDWRKYGLHRWRKTGATRYHEAGVSVRTIQYRLGHESLEVTLDYLGVQHAEDDNAHRIVNDGPLSSYV